MRYALEHPDVVLTLLGQHAWLVLVSLGIAAAIALPLGVAAVRVRGLRGPLLAVLGVLYTVPSLALFVLLIPLMGLGRLPAVTALVTYAQIILVRNVVVGLDAVDPAVVEAARGMGMSPWQTFWRVEFPLGLPVMLAGLRVAVVAVIAIAAVAAFINAGGLGVLLFQGVSQGHRDKIVTGAMAVSSLALAASAAVRALEQRAARPLR
ncbi:MAG: ABC transporter permease [Armatimonadota bacterium]|nr:ABC transporter permease [Armatimonadota bacterium]MDR5697502.1 ABC transporter permease [Armatimonadota bacterium]